MSISCGNVMMNKLMWYNADVEFTELSFALLNLAAASVGWLILVA